MFCRTHSHFICPSNRRWSLVVVAGVLQVLLATTSQQLAILPCEPPTASGQRQAFSSHLRERATQFLCGAEQRVLGCLFGRVQYFADRSQFQSLIVLQLKNHAFAGCQFFERQRDLPAQFAPHQVFFRIGTSAPVRYLCEHVINFAIGGGGNWSFFFSHLLLTNAVEAKIRDDA